MKIGKATIVYDENGNAVEATFTPSSQFNDLSKFRDQLLQVKGGEQEKIISNAERVMASWLNQVNDVELADREQYKITSQVRDCVKNDLGDVRSVSIQFNLEPI